MEKIQTICPQCLKIFHILDDIDLIECVFCKTQYEMPTLSSDKNLESSEEH